MPYYMEYNNSNRTMWPDGRGRLYQPIKLVLAFDILNYYFTKFETRRITSAQKNNNTSKNAR